MDIRIFRTRGQARRIAAWKRLIDAVEARPSEGLWFSGGDLGSNVVLIGQPYVQAHEGRTYWAERHDLALPSYPEAEYVYRVYVFDGESIERVGEHTSAAVALGSAMFLAAV